MRIVALVAFLAVLCAPAAAIGVSRLDIIINVDEQGFASVTESYGISFISDFEFSDFKDAAKKNASSLSAWQATYSFFKPHFADSARNKITESTITFDENSRNLTLKYGLENRIATLRKSEQRADFFAIDDSQLAAFNTAGTIAIPENTTIDIRLPQNAEVDRSSLPGKVQVFGNEVVMSGIQSNSLNITYTVLKPLGPKGGDIIQGISNVYLFAPVLLLIVLAVYVKREEIGEKLEDYLVEHSEIKQRSPEEEFSVDLGK